MLKVLFENLHWSKKLKVLRVINGWNQDEAAARCLTHQKMYWNWEKGRNYPNMRNRKAIAKAFHLKPEDIFSDNDKVNKWLRNYKKN